MKYIFIVSGLLLIIGIAVGVINVLYPALIPNSESVIAGSLVGCVLVLAIAFAISARYHRL